MKWLTGNDEERTAYEVTTPDGKRVIALTLGAEQHNPDYVVREVTGIRRERGFEITGYLD